MASYTVFSDFPDDIAEALDRADAYYHKDMMSMTFSIRSRNLEQPLTDSEKERIKRYLDLCCFSMEVVFEN